jgi:signal transduction histidine kinase
VNAAGDHNPSLLTGLACGALVVTTVTLLVYPLQNLDPGVSSGVLYTLGVLLVSMYWGLRPGIATSVVSAIALDYFHTAPTGHLLGGKDGGDLMAISILFVTCVVGAVIANQARLRTLEATRRAQLEGVQASRARVLAAADHERRRVVRDLHDGAQQRLVHTVITLKLAHRAIQHHEDPAALVDEALQHAEQANTELRELAHGILPAALTLGGLRAGVAALAERTDIPVATDIAVERLPPALEATAYFFVAEALTNVTKHAHASAAEVNVSVDHGTLHMDVSDDGVGGARRDGTGLLGLEDRLAAHDGRLRVVSPPGGGTRLSAVLPLGRGRP